MSRPAICFVSALDYRQIEDGYAFYTRDLLDCISCYADESGSRLVEVILPRQRRAGWKRLAHLAGNALQLRSHFFADYDRKSVYRAVQELSNCSIVVANHYRALVALSKTEFFERPRPPVLYVAHNVESESLASYASHSGEAQYLTRIAGRTYTACLRKEEQSLLRRCDAAIALTGRDGDRLSELAGLRVTVVPPVAVAKPSTTTFSAAPPLELSLAGSFYWGVKRRNLHTFLLATARSRSAFIVNIIGTGLAGLNLEHEFPWARVTDGFENREHVFARSHAIVIPERQASGMKLKALEAFALRKVAIAHENSIEGLPAWIRDAWFIFNDEQSLIDRLDTVTVEAIASRLSEFDDRWTQAMAHYGIDHMRRMTREALRSLSSE